MKPCMETLAFDNPAAGHMRALTRAPAFAQDEYLALLRRHLHAEPDHEIRFFANSRRFAILETLIGERIEKRFETMLNVACGPFAFENYLRPPEHLSIDAFDIWPELSALLRDMRERGRMGNIRFRVSDVGAYETPRSYDLVLINDLFYIRALDFFEHVGRYAAMLKPGGVLYFDLLDRRAGWLWRLAGRDGR
jgi:SAM-dependent methyltransferase